MDKNKVLKMHIGKYKNRLLNMQQGLEVEIKGIEEQHRVVEACRQTIEETKIIIAALESQVNN